MQKHLKRCGRIYSTLFCSYLSI